MCIPKHEVLNFFFMQMVATLYTFRDIDPFYAKDNKPAAYVVKKASLLLNL